MLEVGSTSSPTVDWKDKFVTEREDMDELDGPEDDSRYEMNHTYRGIALIINNEEFSDREMVPRRNGSEKDVECMKDALTKLNFNVVIRTNQTVKKTRETFNDIATTDLKDNDCFVAVILTHGSDNDVIYANDGQMTVMELIEYLLPDKCPSLIGKPKLFFVQACRGAKLDKGVEVPDSAPPPIQIERTSRIPMWADVLLHQSSVQGFYSWRNARTGSWFIQSLGYILQNHGQTMELIEMLTRVNRRVAEEYKSKTIAGDFSGKQMPIFASTLNRKLYFN